MFFCLEKVGKEKVSTASLNAIGIKIKPNNATLIILPAKAACLILNDNNEQEWGGTGC